MEPVQANVFFLLPPPKVPFENDGRKSRGLVAILDRKMNLDSERGHLTIVGLCGGILTTQSHYYSFRDREIGVCSVTKQLCSACQASRSVYMGLIPWAIKIALPETCSRLSGNFRIKTIKPVLCVSQCYLFRFQGTRPEGRSRHGYLDAMEVEEDSEFLESSGRGMPMPIVRNYSCSSCHQEFFSETALQKHTKKQHEVVPQKKHKCDQCSYSSDHTGDFHKHMRIHTGEKPHKCSTCGKTFAQSSTLQTHVRIHTGEMPYRCSTCSKEFPCSSHLQAHMRIHTGEKPYRCIFCGKSFGASKSLRTHMTIHTGEKRYRCPTCGKASADSSGFQTHMRTHTGEKPYMCSVCGKEFASSSHLQTHVRKHTGERPYKCTVCDKTFAQSSGLRYHVRAVACKPKY
uniref:zinc finger protein 664-like n=1 Tax=Myxine glutinosa TaxID=7769 RepID=UPI00358F7DC6